LLRHAPAICGFVELSAAIGVASALLVIAQAGLLTDVIATYVLAAPTSYPGFPWCVCPRPLGSRG
jgi:hypothetical protein